MQWIQWIINEIHRWTIVKLYFAGFYLIFNMSLYHCYNICQLPLVHSILKLKYKFWNWKQITLYWKMTKFSVKMYLYILTFVINKQIKCRPTINGVTKSFRNHVSVLCGSSFICELNISVISSFLSRERQLLKS